VNLLDPGDTPKENAQFLIFLMAVIKAVDEYQDLIRMSVSSAGNDHRLGGHEAPPAIISVFIGDELEGILDAIVNDKPYDRTRSAIQIGVHTIPSFSKDNTDRNRTSPFAFTGNKFEFRMPGSSASIATPNTILNAVVAQSLKEFADVLEKADDLNKAIHDLIIETIKDHNRIIFNGNGYDASWIEEAKKRGLSNYASTPEALSHYLDKKNVDVLLNNKVLSETELHSRYEIYLEKYYKTINIEAMTMLDMLKKDILPSVTRYEKDLLKVISQSKEVGLFNNDMYEVALMETIMDCSGKIVSDMSVLEELLGKDKGSDSLEIAFFYHDEIIPLMEEIRKNTDELEKITDRKYWPMPTYFELLFGVE
jgi:glutamine synthetase